MQCQAGSFRNLAISSLNDTTIYLQYFGHSPIKTPVTQGGLISQPWYLGATGSSKATATGP
jgi:hypothetical protein